MIDLVEDFLRARRNSIADALSDCGSGIAQHTARQLRDGNGGGKPRQLQVYLFTLSAGGLPLSELLFRADQLGASIGQMHLLRSHFGISYIERGASDGERARVEIFQPFSQESFRSFERRLSFGFFVAAFKEIP